MVAQCELVVSFLYFLHCGALRDAKDGVPFSRLASPPDRSPVTAFLAAFLPPPLNSESEKPTPAQIFRLKRLHVREEIIPRLNKHTAGELIRKLVTGNVYHQPYPCKECDTTHDIMHHITYDEFKRREDELRKKPADSAKKED